MTDRLPVITLRLDHYGSVTRTIHPRTVEELIHLSEHPANAPLQALLDAARDTTASGPVWLPLQHLAGQVREQAEAALGALERTGPIVAIVEDDSSHVGRRAVVRYQTTGRPVPRARDEGGDYHGGGDYPQRAAATEAEERARRAAGAARAIVRVGYDLSDVRDDWVRS